MLTDIKDIYCIDINDLNIYIEQLQEQYNKVKSEATYLSIQESLYLKAKLKPITPLIEDAFDDIELLNNLLQYKSEKFEGAIVKSKGEYINTKQFKIN